MPRRAVRVTVAAAAAAAAVMQGQRMANLGDSGPPVGVEPLTPWGRIGGAAPLIGHRASLDSQSASVRDTGRPRTRGLHGSVAQGALSTANAHTSDSIDPSDTIYHQPVFLFLLELFSDSLSCSFFSR